MRFSEKKVSLDLDEANSNLEGIENRSDKSWTIRRMDSHTIDLVKEAADSQGMKIGAWVDNQLKKAAFETLNGGGSTLASEVSELAKQANQEFVREQAEKLQKLESGLATVIQSQNSLFNLFSRLSERSPTEATKV